MPNLIIKSMLVVALLIGCNGPASQPNSRPESQEPSKADKSTGTECDFSSYAPVRINNSIAKLLSRRFRRNTHCEQSKVAFKVKY